MKLESYRGKTPADLYIERIHLKATALRQCYAREPIVFMSRDVLNIIANGTEGFLYHNKYMNTIKVCGYVVKVLGSGNRELYIGFEA